MADWNSPGLTTAYATVLSDLKARDVDGASLFLSAPTNPVVGMIRYERTLNKFQEYRTSPSANWYDLILSAAGGGTGGVSVLGTMAAQNSNAVAITGGSVIGLTTLQLGSDLTMNADDTRSIGTNASRPKYIYVRSGFVLPVGVDKWVP